MVEWSTSALAWNKKSKVSICKNTYRVVFHREDTQAHFFVFANANVIYADVWTLF